MTQPVPQPKRPSLFACTVYGGGKITAHNAGCMEQLRTECAVAGIDLIISRDGGTGTDRARNRQVAVFLETGSDAMIQVDDDVVFEPKDVVKMFRTNLPVIGAAYPCKEIDWNRIVAAVKEGIPADRLPFHASRAICNHLLGGGRVYDEPGMDDFFVAEVGELPTGFLMVRRDALLKFIAFYRDEIEYVTDYPPAGVLHHMVFACDRDPRCGREMAKSRMLQAAKANDVEALVRAAGEYRSTIGDPLAVGRYLTEDYRNTVMWRLTGEKAFLAADVKLAHIGHHAFVGDPRIALGLTVHDPNARQEKVPAPKQERPSGIPGPAAPKGESSTCAACGVRDPSSDLGQGAFKCGQCGHRESVASRGALLPSATAQAAAPTNGAIVSGPAGQAASPPS